MPKMPWDRLAEFTGITGAILLALNIGMNFFGYLFFAASAIIWMLYAYADLKERMSLFRMNLVFLCINLLGLYNYSTL